MTRGYLDFIGRILLRFLQTIHGLGAFALITMGVIVTKFGQASRVTQPLILSQIHRAGLKLLPMVTFLAIAIGFVVIGQTVVLLQKASAQTWAGTVMVSVIVRELGPLVTALLVLARVGTATVIDLSTQRAQGEVEALEALGIDPIHYLVMPRVAGIAVSILTLTVYFIIVALLAGYIFIFLQDVPLRPGVYFEQLASALIWEDFILLAVKTLLFGIVIATVSCYQGLAHPVRLQDVSNVTTAAVAECVVMCLLIDALIIVAYLLLYGRFGF